MFEKQMKKVKAKTPTYAIYLGKRDEVNEDLFIDGKCDVIILYKHEYDSLNQETESLKKQVNDLQSQINEKNSKIKQLDEKIEANNRFYIDKLDNSNKGYSDKIQDLQKAHHDEVSAITSDKQEIIDELKNEVSEMQIQQQKDISKYKEKYKDTLVKLRIEDINDLSDFHKKIDRIKEDFKDLGFFEKHSKTYNNLIKELDESLNEFEKTNKNKLLTIDEDFAKIPSIAVNENNIKSE